MKGHVVSILTPFDAAQRYLVIPVYQRNYDWTAKQCERLFEDVEECVRKGGEDKHFFGSIVGNAEDSFTWVVIDGQQRLTTFSLFLLALIHASEAGDIEVKDPKFGQRLMQSFLQVRDGEDFKFKLKPVKDDQDSYQKLFGPEEFFNEKSSVTANYRYFRKRLRETQYDAETLWNKGMCNLEVMQLELERNDDPQRIFESLNSTGLALKESDKIRNLILMGLPQHTQTEVYEKYWNEMEKNVAFWTDGFIRWYLVAQTAKTPKESNVFEEFKAFLKRTNLSSVEVAKDLHRFSILMKELDSASTGYKQVDQQLRRANLLLGDVTRPFLWLVYRDLKSGVISPEDFTRVIRIVETYIFRRAVVSVPSNALNKIFANAYGELRKLRKHNEDYSNILAYMLHDRGHSGRLPSDDEFAEAFKTRDTYRMRTNYRAYMFESLESADSKDIAGIAQNLANGNLSVEHIMPQTLTKQWRSDLGEGAEDIHKVWRNRVGNLTVTGYNSEYSNQSFEHKLTIKAGFKDSPYTLNSYVKTQNSWGLKQLEERTDALATRALEVWAYPETSFEPVKEALKFEPMGEDNVFTNRKVAAVEVEGTKTPVRTWQDVTVVVLRALLEFNREGVLTAASSTGNLSTNDVEKSGTAGKGWKTIDPALAVFLHNSTDQKLTTLRKVCSAAGYDPDDVLFYLRSEKTADAPEQNDSEPESPFASLLALIPLVEEVEGSDLQLDETTEIRAELVEAVSTFPVDNPLAVLDGQDLASFLASRQASEISNDQALGCLALLRQSETMFGPMLWHQKLLDGTIGKLLAALERA
ncbi:DUF262 domain-containing protein [Corynebacterium tapiri]|uniref:DUF262 domain-containing protein n=1 Tax=Corynebacterium tapiri TaxID=1448266 RepID=A0A5C4U2K0_9CORY|nr:DUF262 domain-containing protein [Corynebacterium tapiri]TNL95593.1 DUF262 domain-containing protein [Corynebacterium tapiri]